MCENSVYKQIWHCDIMSPNDVGWEKCIGVLEDTLEPTSLHRLHEIISMSLAGSRTVQRITIMSTILRNLQHKKIYGRSPEDGILHSRGTN